MVIEHHEPSSGRITDFPRCGFRNKGRTRHATCPRGLVQRIQEPLVELKLTRTTRRSWEYEGSSLNGPCGEILGYFLPNRLDATRRG